MRLLSLLGFVAATTTTAFAAESVPDHAASGVKLETTEKSASSRARAGLTGYSFLLNGSVLNGTGPELSFDKFLGPAWMLTGSVGQAYARSTGAGVTTLFTAIDVTAWYTIYNADRSGFEKTWSHRGENILTYKAWRKPRVRFGLATEQYLFNTSTGALPFSGVGVKILGELGLDWGCDFGAQFETQRVTNGKLNATVTKASVVAIWEFD